MKKTKLFLLHRCLPAILLLFMSLHLFAQGRKVTGKITSARDNQPLPGVTVQLKGTNTATTSDEGGNFSINVVSDESVLVFSFTGMQNVEQRVGSGNSLTIQLQASASALGEVVVVGYGTTRKKDLLVQ